MENDLISRAKTIETLKNTYCTGCDSYNGVRCRACWVDDAENAIDAAPSIEAEPVRHGRWTWITEDIYRCENCGERVHVKEVMGRPDWDYCPNCGAKMDAKEDD